jgi:hypothetical protein
MVLSDADSKKVSNNLWELYQKGLIRIENVSVQLRNGKWQKISLLDFCRLIDKKPASFKRFSFIFVEACHSKK